MEEKVNQLSSLTNLFKKCKFKENYDLSDIEDKPWTINFDKKVNKIDIYYCFRLLLGRNPSKEEWPGHSGFVGTNLTNLVSSYLSSAEFKNRNLLSYNSD